MKNVLVFNPGNCSKILGNHIGYEIHDSEGNLIFKVSTKFESIDQLEEECYITTIEANFFNKANKLVFHAKSDGKDDRIESCCKSAFGFSGGGFGIVNGYNQDEIELVKLALLTKGYINQRLTGEHLNEQIELDGRIVQNANLKKCEILIKDGNFIIGPNNSFESCKFNFVDKAGQIFNLVQMLSCQKNR